MYTEITVREEPAVQPTFFFFPITYCLLKLFDRKFVTGKHHGGAWLILLSEID